jgi:hypothetical protein
MEVKDLAAINNKFGTGITWAEYFRLRAVVALIKGRFKTEEEEEEEVEPRELTEFMNSVRRGCKKYRKIINGRRTREYKNNDPTDIAAAVTLWGEGRGEMGRKLIELNYGIWKMSRLEAMFKNFLFKIMQGRLYLNQALSHFTDTEPMCTFCVLKEKNDMNREGLEIDGQEWNNRLRRLSHESVLHLFWNCDISRKVINGITRRLSGWEEGTVTKVCFFGGLLDYSVQNMQMSILIVHYIKFYLYNSRLMYRIPTIPQGIYELDGLFNMFRHQVKWSEQIEDIPELVGRLME